MIPVFPHFKTFELDDRVFIEEFTKQFPPYNDFEFTSLWTYNTADKNAFSVLNNNLVIKIQDFITGDFFYSFLGTNETKNTITKLLKKSKEDNYAKLYLVPEINFQSLAKLQELFSIKEDRDSFDYIISVDETANLEGSKYSTRRNHINKFKKNYPNHTIEMIDLTRKEIKQDIIKLFFLWEKQKGKNRNETVIELTAIEKFLDLVHTVPIQGLGIYIQGELIGFSTYHIVQDSYAILSFIKGNTSYIGIYEYLYQEIAKQLKKLGVKYLNYEQDLGIPGLRKAKLLWHPVFFLKKYTIEEL